MSAMLLSDEYKVYQSVTATFTIRQMILAIFISIMAISSVVAVFTTNALLKKKQYGIWIANGFTLSDIAAEIAIEIFIIIFCSGILLGNEMDRVCSKYRSIQNCFANSAYQIHASNLYCTYFYLTGIAALIL